VSEVAQYGDFMYIGSYESPFLGKVKLNWSYFFGDFI
jgi:hypothetical protein